MSKDQFVQGGPWSMAIIKTVTENHSYLFQNDWSDVNQVTFKVYAAEFLRETMQSHFNAK